ncbi:sugar phosphate nucleotidyltransferase [Lysobacter panacisoli]|uniref:Nucleotidyl transferase domain-containing protein n=1 Tax=Lysobacter panacisoli TaxID=1255263 RepID=A0ABP9LAW0_9GAMM|nr:sugar phosphate nucleotidyltransferase [Lysobacter panacisoli]
MSYPAVILAAGRGSRMGNLGTQVQKALLPVGDEPIIGHHLHMLRSIGVEQVHVVVGHRSSDVEAFVGDGTAYGLRVTYVVQSTQLGIAHAVAQLRSKLCGPFLLLLGDYFFIADEPRRMIQRLDEGVSAILAKQEPDAGLIVQSCELRLGAGNLVSCLVEKPVRPAGNLKGCGLYALQPEIFDYISRTPRTCLRDEYELTVSLDMFARDGHPLRAEVMPVWDHNLTYPMDVLVCNMEWLERHRETRFFAASASVDPSAELVNVVVGPQARIGSGARLNNVVVFPRARVAARACIENALATTMGVVAVGR